jgi:hypothetical protein
VCYEGAGTVGAFLATPLIAVFGEAYGLAPVPILLSLAGIGYRLLRKGSITVKGDTSLDDSRHSNASCDGTSAHVPLDCRPWRLPTLGCLDGTHRLPSSPFCCVPALV